MEVLNHVLVVKKDNLKMFLSTICHIGGFLVLSRSRWTLFQALFFCFFVCFVFLEKVKTDGNFFKTIDFLLQVSVKHNGQKFI